MGVGVGVGVGGGSWSGVGVGGGSWSGGIPSIQSSEISEPIIQSF